MTLMVKELGTEATMVSYLMEVGWELYVTSSPKRPPRLIKRVGTGRVMEVKTCDVAVDTVIELQLADRLVSRKKFSVGRVRTHVYVLKAIRK